MIQCPLAVTVWKWGPLFSAAYVNRMQAMLQRHLHVPHRLICVTDDASGIDPGVEIVALPESLRDTPRCRRRMRQFDFDFVKHFGPRILALDLDVVIVNDITPLVARPEPLVCWKVRHAQVYSGSILLMAPAALHGLWLEFAADPDGYPRRADPRGVPSDQAMLNFYLRDFREGVPQWTEADGLVTYFGAGYERHEHLGVGPRRQTLPANARMVVLGSADKAVMDEGRYPWIREHWSNQAC